MSHSNYNSINNTKKKEGDFVLGCTCGETDGFVHIGVP
jgi:hypothetical protein